VGGRNGGGRPMNGEKGAARNGSGFGMFSSGEPGKGSGDGAVFNSAPSTGAPLELIVSYNPTNSIDSQLPGECIELEFVQQET